METPEEVVGHKDVANINVIKGKRTKRQRPQSPIPFTIATHLSSGDGMYGSNGDHNNNNDDDDNNSNNNNSSSSPAYSDEFAISTTTEDEDTAKLLILLAQGRSREYSSAKNNSDHHHDQDYYVGTPVKFNSKRYIETSSTGNGKTGMYVYECKTCNRTFPSFQALGGHRASHKKPKNMAAAEEKKQYSFAFSDEDEGFFKNNNNNNNNNLSPLSYQLGNVNNMSNKYSSSPKIHECSYCGAEFTSGQALGGHMRRHRGSNVVANTALSLSPLSPLSVNQDSEEAKNKLRNNGVSLSLDLNLPAPEDDHNKFSFAIKQQQQQNDQEQQQEKKETTLVLSTTPTLVDCHY